MDRRSLEDSARLLKQRLAEIDARKPAEHEVSIHAIGRDFVRKALTNVGHQLSRLSTA